MRYRGKGRDAASVRSFLLISVTGAARFSSSTYGRMGWQTFRHHHHRSGRVGGSVWWAYLTHHIPAQSTATRTSALPLRTQISSTLSTRKRRNTAWRPAGRLLLQREIKGY